MIYQGGGGNAIGTLLRMLEDEKSASPLQQKPESAVGSPLRGAVQTPYFTPESPGSSRVVSARPEGVTPSGPQSSVTAGNVVAPVAPIRPTPSMPVSPVRPVSPIAPQIRGSAPVPTPVPTPSPTPRPGVSVAPKITGQVAGASTYKAAPGFLPSSQYKATPSSIGQKVVTPRAIPTPTPNQQQVEQSTKQKNKTPGGNKFYRSTWGFA